MKHIFTTLLSLLPVSLFALSVGETVPSLQLSDRVVTNVTVISISPAYIIAKWDGGRGTIARSNIPSFPVDNVGVEAQNSVKDQVAAKVQDAKTKATVSARKALAANGYTYSEYTEVKAPFVPLRFINGKPSLAANAVPDTNFTAEHFAEMYNAYVAYRNRAHVNPTVVHQYKTDVSVPFSRLGTQNVTFTRLENSMDKVGDIKGPRNSVASFNGFEIPYTGLSALLSTLPDYSTVPSLLAQLSRKPVYTNIVLPPNTLTLITPYKMLSYTYGKDLDTVIKIKSAVGNKTTDFVWKQPIPVIFTTEPIKAIEQGALIGGCVLNHTGLEMEYTGDKVVRKEHTKNRDGAERTMFHTRVRVWSVDKALTEASFQHEIGHILDVETPNLSAFSTREKGRFNMGESAMDEYYVLASLLNRAHYFLFGEPITTKEQTLNMLALAAEYIDNNAGYREFYKTTRPSIKAITISHGNLPTNIVHATSDFSTIPAPIQSALLYQLNNPEIRGAITDGALANEWLSYYARLAM